MPVTQRWVHGGLISAVCILSICLTVLALGAARKHSSDVGLPNSKAAAFHLRDTAGETVDLKPEADKVRVLIFAKRDGANLSPYVPAIQQLLETYVEDETVELLGVSYVLNSSLLGPNAERGPLEVNFPSLRVAVDADGAVARAFRVSGGPTLFVIDQQGVIRSRLPLDNDSAVIAASESINALRDNPLPVHQTMGGLSAR